MPLRNSSTAQNYSHAKVKNFAHNAQKKNPTYLECEVEDEFLRMFESLLSNSPRNLFISSSIFRISASNRSRMLPNSASITEKSPIRMGTFFCCSDIVALRNRGTGRGKIFGLLRLLFFELRLRDHSSVSQSCVAKISLRFLHERRRRMIFERNSAEMRFSG